MGNGADSMQSETAQPSYGTGTKDDVTPQENNEESENRGCLGIKLFTLFGCMATALMGLHYQYYFGSVRMLEKQFGFKSTQSGWLRGMEHLSGLIMVVVLGYCGDVFNKAKLIAWCTLISGISTCLMTLPQFVVFQDKQEYNKSSNSSRHTGDIMCDHTPQRINCNETQEEIKNTSGDVAFWVFFFVRVMFGIGATSHSNLIMAYIHGNSPPKQASFLICN